MERRLGFTKSVFEKKRKVFYYTLNVFFETQEVFLVHKKCSPRYEAVLTKHEKVVHECGMPYLEQRHAFFGHFHSRTDFGV